MAITGQRRARGPEAPREGPTPAHRGREGGEIEGRRRARYLPRCPERAGTCPGSPHSPPRTGSTRPPPATRTPFSPTAAGAEGASSAPSSDACPPHSAPSSRLSSAAAGKLLRERRPHGMRSPASSPGRGGAEIGARATRAQLGRRAGPEGGGQSAAPAGARRAQREPARLRSCFSDLCPLEAKLGFFFPWAP